MEISSYEEDPQTSLVLEFMKMFWGKYFIVWQKKKKNHGSFCVGCIVLYYRIDFNLFLFRLLMKPLEVWSPLLVNLFLHINYRGLEDEEISFLFTYHICFRENSQELFSI